MEGNFWEGVWEMTDSVSVISDWLQTSGTGLYTLCGKRITSPIASGWDPGSQKGVIFHLAAETSAAAAPQQTTQFVFKCYGATNSYADARTVYRALHDALHGKKNKTVSSGILVEALLAVGGQNSADPKTGWPVVLATFGIRTE